MQESTIIEKKSITALLDELKVLAARIVKLITSTQFTTSFKSNNAPAGFSSVAAFEDKANATYQSIMDLIERRNKIKAAIVKSNASTFIVVAGKTYTVAEAIERKNSIEFERNLLAVLSRQYEGIVQFITKNNQLLQGKLDTLIEVTLGKEKSDPNTMKQITDNFWIINEVKCSDPLHLINRMETLQEDIESFMSSVNVALTVSNSRIEIEI